MKGYVFALILGCLCGGLLYGITSLPWLCCLAGGLFAVWVFNLVFLSVFYIADKKNDEQGASNYNGNNNNRFALFMLLLTLLCIGLYMNAINHRYKSIGGTGSIAVMDTWTKTMLLPDSTGHYKPFANPYIKTNNP